MWMYLCMCLHVCTYTFYGVEHCVLHVNTWQSPQWVSPYITHYTCIYQYSGFHCNSFVSSTFLSGHMSFLLISEICFNPATWPLKYIYTYLYLQFCILNFLLVCRHLCSEFLFCLCFFFFQFCGDLSLTLQFNYPTTCNQWNV